MANLQVLKSRIESIEKTASITKAMHRIAASKLTGTQQLFDAYHVFKNDFEQVIQDLVFHVPNHEYVTGHDQAKKQLFILISSDRGLAGGYHQQLFSSFQTELKNYDKQHIDVFVIGKKGFYFANKMAYHLLNDGFVSNKDQLSITNYDMYVDLIEQLYKQGTYSKIRVYYNKYINAMKQEPTMMQLLPIELNKDYVGSQDFVYEGRKEKIFDEVIKIYLQSRIYGAMVDAKLSEFSSRIVAMKQATDNATDVLSALRLKYNQARQQKITNDLLDITNGKGV